MYASQLKELVKSDSSMSKVFGGIFAKDKLPQLHELKTDRAFIVNSDESDSVGEHWLLVYFVARNKTVIWFDPLGHDPSYYGSPIVYWLSSSRFKLVSNIKSVQSTQSYYCGLFVLFVYYYLAHGLEFSTIMNKFSTYLMKNDSLVQQFAWLKFRFDARKELHK